MDTLSLLLSMANVSCHSDILVVDMVGGLLTGAVAERLGGVLFILNKLAFEFCSLFFLEIYIEY